MDPVYPEQPKRRRGRKVVTCPKTICSQQYKYGSKANLLRHINNVHIRDKDYAKIMKKINILFPERNKVPKRKCNLCGAYIAGRGAQIKKHQKSSSCKNKRT